MHVVDPSHRGPELVGLDPGGGEGCRGAGVGPVPLVFEAHLPSVRRRLQRAVLVSRIQVFFFRYDVKKTKNKRK